MLLGKEIESDGKIKTGGEIEHFGRLGASSSEHFVVNETIAKINYSNVR